MHPLWSTLTTTAATLNKFVVKFSLDRSHKDHIDRWISFSIASRAKHVGLVFKIGVTWSDSEADKYDLPLCNFSGPNGSCVESLDLCYVCLKLHPSFCGMSNLKKLTLHTVSVNLSDFQCLLTSCALLESLDIEHIEWLSQEWHYFHSLCIHQELGRLQHLRMHEYDLSRIELHAPNLTTIEFNTYPYQIVLSEFSKVSEATFTSYRRSRMGVHDALAEVFDRVPTDFPHLHRLFLDLGLETSVCSLKKFLISFFIFPVMIFALILISTYLFFRGRGLFQVRSFSQTQTRFMKLRYLNINLRITGMRLPGDTSWVMGLVNLLELTPLLEELELHVSK